MPIYEYQCESCGHALEKLQRISDDPLKECPECGKAELRRLVSAAGFRLKGAGWYETDFKKGDKKNLHDTGSSKNPDSKPAESETSKPAATKKAESKPKPGA
jgi:putative FmdB family regulatory protein